MPYPDKPPLPIPPLTVRRWQIETSLLPVITGTWLPLKVPWFQDGGQRNRLLHSEQVELDNKVSSMPAATVSYHQPL
jgi:hypothetical protein